ncbi:hypothetical protein [Streptomyces sp. NPDC051554]|uniref:hypothetical protein n=1 Tax=Streptomyces sp. NPDC051554 TaxID=3365656 RepID=UPI00379059B8
MSERPDKYELQAQRLRILAGLYRKKAAELDMAAAAALATRSMRKFAEAWDAGIAQDVAQHPDLAELNIQLDGFYGAGLVRPGEETTT